MSGFVYRWTDTSNGMYYIGSHKGTPDDGYIGSGTWFKSAYKKRPNSFHREILYIGKDYRELEEFILKEVNAADNNQFYNLKNKAVGFDEGENNPRFGKNKGKEHPNFGRAMSEQHKQKLSKIASLRTGEKNSFYGKSHSKESREKIAKANNISVFVDYTKKEYPSVAKAAKDLNVSIHKLYNMLYGKTKNKFGIKRIN